MDCSIAIQASGVSSSIQLEAAGPFQLMFGGEVNFSGASCAVEARGKLSLQLCCEVLNFHNIQNSGIKAWAGEELLSPASTLVISVKLVSSRTSQHCFRWNYNYGNEPNMMNSCCAREMVHFLSRGHLGAMKLKFFCSEWEWEEQKLHFESGLAWNSDSNFCY